MRTMSLFAARSMSIELMPADFSFSFSSLRSLTSSWSNRRNRDRHTSATSTACCSEAETVRMSFLSMGYFFPFFPDSVCPSKPCERGAGFRDTFVDSCSATLAAWRSARRRDARRPRPRRALYASGSETRGPSARDAKRFPARTFVHKRFGNVKLVHVERRSGVVRFLFGIGDSTAQNFFNVLLQRASA